MLGPLIAILTFSRRTDPITGPAKVIDGDTIVVAEQLVRLHGIEAPELHQPFWWRGQQLLGGMMALAALVQPKGRSSLLHPHGLGEPKLL